MLSFPRRRRGKDNRQLYLVPDITSFILVYQRDDHIIYYDYPFSTPTENAVNTRYTQTASDPVRLLLSCCADGPPADTAPGIYCVECTYLKLYIVHYNCPARSHRTALTAKPP